MPKLKVSRTMGMRLVGLFVGAAFGFAIRLYLLPLAIFQFSHMDVAFTKETLQAMHGGKAFHFMRWWIAVFGFGWAFWIHTSSEPEATTSPGSRRLAPGTQPSHDSTGKAARGFNAAFLASASMVLSPYTVVSGATGLFLFGACTPRSLGIVAQGAGVTVRAKGE